MAINRALLASKIESLTSTEHAEIFRMLQRGIAQGVTYTHNQNGVFYNLNDIADDVLTEVSSFVDYCVHNAALLQEYDNNLLMRHNRGGSQTKAAAVIDDEKDEKVTVQAQQATTTTTKVTTTTTNNNNLVGDSAKFLQARKKLNKPRVLAFYTKDEL